MHAILIKIVFKNMNYTILPPEMVYNKRKSIDEFDINTDGSIDFLMLKMIYNSMIIELDGAPNYILEIFNTARYITTLIIAEKNPMLYFSEYIKIAGKIGVAEGYEHNTYWRYFSSITFAIVINYLKAYDDKYMNEDEILIKKITYWNYNQYLNSGLDKTIHKLFYNSILNKETILMARKYLKGDEFKPNINNSIPDNMYCTDEDIDEMFMNNPIPAIEANKTHENEEQLRRELSEAMDKIAELNKQIQIKDLEIHKITNSNIEMKEMIVELLKPIFYGSEDDVIDFLDLIKGKDDITITDIVHQWVKNKKITDKSKGRPLWQVLHAAKLYRATEQNWNTALRNHI